MNFPRVMIDHGDILTFLMLQEFITVVIRVMWLHHGLLYTVKWLSCDGPRSLKDPTDSY